MRPTTFSRSFIIAALRSSLPPLGGPVRRVFPLLPLLVAARGPMRTGPPAPVAVTLDAVLLRVADSLVEAGIVAAGRALVSLDAEPFPAAGGPQCVLCPGDFAAREAHQAGLARSLATEDGTFAVHVADLCVLDEGGQDRLRLLATDPARKNLLRVAGRVKDLLNGKFVADRAGNLLSIEPVFYRGSSRPRRYAADPTWAGLDLTFSLSYVAAMGGDDLDLDGT